MKIIVAKTAGFCMGVKRAVDRAIELSNDKSCPVWTLGPLIHNKQTTDMLRQRGVNALDEGSPPAAPATLLTRAHGVPPGVMERYKDAGYGIVDGTCPKVKAVHNVIVRYRKDGYTIVIAGDEGHAEVIGLLGYAGGSGCLVQTPDDIDRLTKLDKICLVSQTTFDRALFDLIAERLARRFGGDLVVKKTICSATDARQEEAGRLALATNAVIVVGGKNSANTQRLVKIARERGAHTQGIETEDEIDWEPLRGCKTVGVTAGASTPNWMIKRVCDHLLFLSRTTGKDSMSTLMRVFDVMANLNLFVSSGAVAAYYASCAIQRLPFSAAGGAIALFYFISVYLWNSLTSLENTLHLDISKYRFYNRYPRLLFLLSGASILAALATAFLINRPTFYLMLFATAAGSVYHITLVPKGLRGLFPYKSLKDIPSSRDIFVALAWATILTFLPQTTGGALKIIPSTMAAFAVVFILSFIRSLIFDLRDIEGDRIMGRETLITIIGETRARQALSAMIWACVCLLMISPAVKGLTAYRYPGTLRYLFQIPALVYAAVFVRLNAGIRPNHSALFCLLADGIFYLAALGAFVAAVIA
jgi:4-hydroxy-3-methylbut-2-enyl diphosphate reductase